jgi:PAS domain S-box-containing protein
MRPAVRILHLEDDPLDVRLIREHLSRSGLDVSIQAAGTREAFEAALAQSGFDVVLADYHVPRFNGLEALELVRRTAPKIPFIVVTGALGDERAVELLRSGATDFVLKDRLARLAPAIQRALADLAAHIEHEAVQAHLAQAHRLGKLAAEAARMGTWQLDIASGTLNCSEDFLTLLGVHRAAWPGTVRALEAAVHPEDVERLRHFYVHTGLPGRFVEVEFRIHKSDGEVRWMHSRGDCILEADGAPATFFGVMMDITKRKQIEAALRDTDRRKDEFLATLAHELRNPLAPIHNALLVLRGSPVQSAETEQVHAMLDRQVKHMIRLVDDLLDVSRVTLGKIELKRAAVDLQMIVQSAVEMSRTFIEAGAHRLDIRLPAAPIILEGDVVRLTQVLSNLLNNAAKYTNAGGRIQLSAQIQDAHAVISVQDNGVGIPELMLDRIFNLFTQVEGTDAHDKAGLGIGLAMVRKLVELHGGEVEARSDGPGRGSEFIVRLPVTMEVDAQSGNPSDATSDASLAGRRVLVVDDNCDSADSLGLLLKLSGADTHVVYDGAAALEALAAFEPDVVLLDLGMPGMNGYMVAGRIRQDPRHQNLTLIALTGYGQEQDVQRSRAAGFNHHLTKPADMDALMALLVSVAPHAKDKQVVRDS